MKHVYWLKDDKIAGRTGPNTHMWDLEDLKSNGIAAILSVNHGEGVHETLLSSLDIAYANIPMSSNAPVREGDCEYCLENIPRAMEFIGKHICNGTVLVHCRSGKDRTGMVLAAYLIEFEGRGAKQAMDEVLGVRPIAFTAEGWKEFTLDVLDRYKTQLGQPLEKGENP